MVKLEAKTGRWLKGIEDDKFVILNILQAIDIDDPKQVEDFQAEDHLSDDDLDALQNITLLADRKIQDYRSIETDIRDGLRREKAGTDEEESTIYWAAVDLKSTFLSPNRFIWLTEALFWTDCMGWTSVCHSFDTWRSADWNDRLVGSIKLLVELIALNNGKPIETIRSSAPFKISPFSFRQTSIFVVSPRILCGNPHKWIPLFSCRSSRAVHTITRQRVGNHLVLSWCNRKRQRCARLFSSLLLLPSAI